MVSCRHLRGHRGVRTPATIKGAINEFLVGSQPAAFFYLVGPAILDVLYRVGNAQQRHWARIGIEREWGATMVLTEAEAGSDVGAIRTRAREQGDGTWHIEGSKRFITSGDSDDLFENIAHLVLARPVGASPETKGLSLYFVPKSLPDPQTGEPCARNGVYATGLEHKLGLTASATCEMVFGGHDKPAVGYLVGDVHDGIAQMFRIMEFARMAVGIKAIGTLSTGYLHAADYARGRVQGVDMARAADSTAPRVPIIEHPTSAGRCSCRKPTPKAGALYTSTPQPIKTRHLRASCLARTPLSHGDSTTYCCP